MARRLGLRERPRRVPRKVVQVRVRAIWKEHPEFTVNQVRQRLEPQYPHGETLIASLLRQCRKAAAQRSPTYRQVGWPVDRETAVRIRIGAIWKRHPEFTAREVIGKLGGRCSVRLPWVQKVLRECWRACGSLSPRQRLIGRRRYHSWRGRVFRVHSASQQRRTRGQGAAQTDAAVRSSMIKRRQRLS
jgi:hypothetical protein